MQVELRLKISSQYEIDLTSEALPRLLMTQDFPQLQFVTMFEKNCRGTRGLFQRPETEANLENNSLACNSQTERLAEDPKNPFKNKIMRKKDQIVEAHSALQALKQNFARFNQHCENSGCWVPPSCFST